MLAFVSHPVTVAVAAFLVMGAVLVVSRLGTDPEELTLRKYREQVLDGRVRTAKLGEESNSVTGKRLRLRCEKV